MKHTKTDQLGLFPSESAPAPKPKITANNPAQTPETRANTPLAHRARPQSFDQFFGQEHIFKRYAFLRSQRFPSLILWGPPGTGKTTLAHLLANQSGKELYSFSAVLGGVNELKKLIQSAEEVKRLLNKQSIIFIDEIHRFNKSQQDALLPYVEEGAFTLIGATTENPRSAVNRALLSRLQIIELKSLSNTDMLNILKRVNTDFELALPEETVLTISDYAYGDARRALNILDLIQIEQKLKGAPLLHHEVKQLILENSRDYDRNKDRHYDVISAFIKSMRGSDPNAALLWLAVMLDGGEDPVFIARRLVIFASEDVGNADPQGLVIATAALQAVQNIGMPEARICLSQAVTYVACAQKSNAAYNAINQAMAYVEGNTTIEVPDHLRNLSPEIKNYKYPHAYPDHYVKQRYTKGDIPEFYQPTEMGRERELKAWLDHLRSRED